MKNILAFCFLFIVLKFNAQGVVAGPIILASDLPSTTTEGIMIGNYATLSSLQGKVRKSFKKNYISYGKRLKYNTLSVLKKNESKKEIDEFQIRLDSVYLLNDNTKKTKYYNKKKVNERKLDGIRERVNLLENLVINQHKNVTNAEKIIFLEKVRLQMLRIEEDLNVIKNSIEIQNRYFKKIQKLMMNF